MQKRLQLPLFNNYKFFSNDLEKIYITIDKRIKYSFLKY